MPRRANPHQSSLAPIRKALNHDLRAPIRHIRGFTQILGEELGEGMAPEARALLDRTRAAADRLEQMVDVLHRYLQLATEPPPTRPDVRVGDVLGTVADRALPALRARALGLRSGGAVDTPVWANAESLADSLVILVHHLLASDSVAEDLEVEVTDNGPTVVLQFGRAGSAFPAALTDAAQDLFPAGRNQAPSLALARHGIESQGGRLDLQAPDGSVRPRVILRRGSRPDVGSGPTTTPAGPPPRRVRRKSQV